MSSPSIGISQVQPQQQSLACSQRASTPDNSQSTSNDFNWSSSGQVAHQQGSSPLRIKTKGRFTIIEEEGSSPKLSFRLPSWGGSQQGQRPAAASNAGSSQKTTAPLRSASTSGTLKALTEVHADPLGMTGSVVGGYQPASSFSRRSAAGALQMPAHKQ